jgi:hypothetical protein
MFVFTPTRSSLSVSFCQDLSPSSIGDFDGWQAIPCHPFCSGEHEPMRPRDLSFDARYAYRKWCDCRRARSLRSRSHSRAKPRYKVSDSISHS